MLFITVRRGIPRNRELGFLFVSYSHVVKQIVAGYGNGTWLNGFAQEVNREKENKDRKRKKEKQKEKITVNVNEIGNVKKCR